MRGWLAFSAALAIGRIASSPTSVPASQKRSIRPAGHAEPRNQIAPTQQLLGNDIDKRDGNIVLFRQGGRKRLAQLADQLRSSLDLQAFEGCGAGDHDPILLRLIAGSTPRLWIDSTAHVEFREEQSSYRVVLGEALITRITLETPDFEEVRQFVWQYLLATRSYDSPIGDRA
jgi:hypothetical protein